MKLNFNIRRSFHLGKVRHHRIAIEAAGFNCSPSIRFAVDGSDRELHLRLCLGLGLYLTLPMPKTWVPMQESGAYGMLPVDREVAISFHNWSLWWSLWMPPYEWNHTDSKWRRGSFHVDDLLFGKHTCEFQVMDTQEHNISFIEGNYRVVVTQKKRIDRWPRWFTKTSVAYEVDATPKPIPHEGKGENSWDCGETFTSSSRFPARDCRTCYDAALYFEHSMKKKRAKYGGPNWVPREFRDKATILV